MSLYKIGICSYCDDKNKILRPSPFMADAKAMMCEPCWTETKKEYSASNEEYIPDFDSNKFEYEDLKKSREIKEEFIVIKIEDLKYINSIFKIAMLKNDLNDIEASRKAEGKKINEYLVVNKDEPYATLVENLILNKVSVEDIPDEIKEKILKEYAEDLYEEFMQVDRFEREITLKDVIDLLQIGSDKEQ